MMNSIYWTRYKVLEEEVLNMTSSICMNNHQKEVYSYDIADVITRSSIEIESIAKDLYRRYYKNKEPDGIGVCISIIEEMWHISRKNIEVINSSISINEFERFAPFDYKKDSEDDYVKVYNSLKHDRVKNLHKATVRMMVRTLGALYILNLYYLNKKIYLGEDYYGESIDKTMGSSLFQVLIAPCEDEVILDSQKNIDNNACIYKISRLSSDRIIRIVYVNHNNLNRSISLSCSRTAFQTFLDDNVNTNINEVNFWHYMKTNGLMDENEFKKTHKVKRINDIFVCMMPERYIANINV